MATGTVGRVRSRRTARMTRWALVPLLVAALAATGAAAPGAAAGQDRPTGQDVLVRRTAFGIPHILASDYRGLGLGTGYAYAEDNLCLLADTVLTLSGERSRWFGAEASTTYGVSNIDSDLYHGWLNQTGVVERLLARPAPIGPSRQARDLARGYAAGYNRYLAQTTVANLPDPACRGAGWVRPITDIDIWRVVYQVTGVTGSSGLQDLIVAARPPAQDGTAAPAAPAGELARLRPEGIGSNGVALGRQATTGGAGMVLGNPHLPWDGFMRFYQLQLTIPGELNVSGGALAGLPMIGIGHTDRLAWTHTASTAQTFTLTQLALAGDDPTSYVVDGQVVPMRRETVTVTVREPGGDLTPVSRTLYRTPDGPLLALEGLEWTTTTAYALHDANAGNLRMIDQWLAMARARNVTELHAALSRVLGLPWVNTMAADASGTAYYSDVQVVPHVTDGRIARCAVAGPELGVVILDGSRSRCGWGSDPDAVAPGLFGASRLPALFRTDHVSNMNDSPWLTNPAAPLTRYPAMVGDVGTARAPRTRLGLDMIADRLDGSDGLGPAGFTLASLQATMFGNRNLTAEQGRAAIVEMCTANPTLTATDGLPVDVRAACAALAGWDGRGDLDARGAILWRLFMGVSFDQGVDVWRVPFDPAEPARTPRGFDADRPEVRQTFADTVHALDALAVPVDVRLGDFQHYAGVPIHGCGDQEGCFNSISVEGLPGPGGTTDEVSHGSTFIMAVALTPAGPHARTILTYGQSVNPTSPHYTDQTRLYSAKQWVTGRFTEAEIAADPELTLLRLPR